MERGGGVLKRVGTGRGGMEGWKEGEGPNVPSLSRIHCRVHFIIFIVPLIEI